MDPLVICGHHRSGTTLLRSLLDGHPDVAAFPLESELIRAGFQPAAGSPPTARELVEALVARARGHEFTAHLDVDAFAAAARRRLDGAPDPIGLGALTGLVIEAYAEVTGQASARYWADKTPRVEGDLADVLPEVPDLRAIYIVRDPRDVYASSFSRSRRRGVPDGGPAALARSWVASLGAWHAFLEAGGDGLQLRYEELCEAPRPVMARVADHLGIDWSDALVVPSLGGGPWGANSSHERRDAGVDQRSVGRWRTVLAEDDAALLEAVCAPAMRRLGYEARRPSPARLGRLVLRRRTGPAVRAIAEQAVPVSTTALRRRWRALRRRGAVPMGYVARG